MDFVIKRLTKELSKLKEEGDKLDGIIIDDPQDILAWNARIIGPPDTPYQDGIFEMLLKFDSDFLIWADAGGLRDDISNYQNVTWPNLTKVNELDNNKVTFFCHHPYVRVANDQYKFHAFSQMRYIQGGAVFVPKKCIEDICELFKTTALDCISKGFVGSDEKIFDLINRHTYLIHLPFETYSY